MDDRPVGTVTFLFTDIEGSTRLLRDLGAERYRQVLNEHRRLLRRALTTHGGYEVDTQGDAFLVAFDRPRAGVEAAADAQRAFADHAWPNGRDLRVRMGVHTCEATATTEGYVGIGIHRGRRICEAAHGGQVLVSHITRDLLEADEHGLMFLDLGEHRLKDLTEPQRLFQLLLQDLPGQFPPLRTLGNRPTNLPVQATPLVGRDREVGDVIELLRRPDVRAVTLTGPGGIGKTRLALQAAAELLEDFPNGVHFVTVAAITDPNLVLPAIAQTLGVNETAGQELSAYLETKDLLLVVDSLEQVIDAALLLARALADAPSIKLLMTSQEALHVSAEHVYPVPPLRLPDPRQLPELSALQRNEAIALFTERAQAVRPDFEVTNENSSTVSEICVRLDGLPLALELAAARIGVLSPDAMLKRLGKRLQLLRRGGRDVPERQQTLADTVAWSYDLLDGDQRVLFARLGVFAGGFTLEAAEAVCNAELDTLGSLIDKSLVRRDGDRFAMLETVREYSLERLAASGDDANHRDRHAAFFEEMAVRAYDKRFDREAELAEELEREHDNLRAALDVLGEVGLQRRLRLAGRLGWFWHVRSHLSEGRDRLSEALAGTPSRDEDRACALLAAGELAASQGDGEAAIPLIEEAQSIWRQLGREQEIALGLHHLGWAHSSVGDLHTAREYMERSLELQKKLGRPFLVNRAQLGLLQILIKLGDVQTVRRLAPEALELARRLGDLPAEGWSYHFLADCALLEEDFVGAEEEYRRSLDIARRTGDEAQVSYELQGVAMAAAGREDARRALRMGGAADSRLRALGVGVDSFWTALVDRYLGKARAALGSESADAAWDGGCTMGFNRAIEEAIRPDASQ